MTHGLNFMSMEVQELKQSSKYVNEDKISELENELELINHQTNRKNLIID